LFEAARNNQVPVMAILLAHDADIEAHDVDQVTALIMAAKAGKLKRPNGWSVTALISRPGTTCENRSRLGPEQQSPDDCELLQTGKHE